MQNRVAPLLTALSENSYLSAIRAGMVSIVPLTIIGGLFMIVSYFPSAPWEKIVQPYLHLLQVPVTATFGLLAVFVCFAIAYDLGKRLKQEAIVSATIATVVFLMLQINELTFSMEGISCSLSGRWSKSLTRCASRTGSSSVIRHCCLRCGRTSKELTCS